MDRWKSRGGKSQRRERVKTEDAAARKGSKVAAHCVFPMICGSGRSTSRLAKVAGAEPSGEMRWKSARCCGAKHMSKSKYTKHTILRPLLEVEMIKKCTPLWRAAHFEVKMCKTHHSQTTFGWWNSCTPLHQLRSTFGSWDDEKVPAVVARSTFWSQHVQNSPVSKHFRKLKCWKKCTPLWREAHLQIKM